MKRAPHIAYVCADRGVPIGGCKGASAHVWELTRALANRGAEVRIVAARAHDGHATGTASVSVTDLGADRASRLMRQAVFAAARTRRQQARAAEAHGLLFNQVLARELERLHRRWRIDAIYERYSLWSYAAAGFARAARIPYLLEVNAPLRQEQRRYRILENDAAAASLEAYLFRSANHVIVPSAALRPYVISRGARAGGVRVVANAADPALFQLEAMARTRERHAGEFVVGFLGTLKPWHGVEDLLRAFRRLRRAFAGYRLLIAGDGPLRPVLERTLRQYGLREAATFSGEIAHGEVPRLLAQMDVAVAPYPILRGFYFSPLKVFEYMAAGVPVVASDIGQIGEVLAHRKTALLYRPGAVTEMAARIDELRRRPALAARLARAARQRVCRRYTWERNADRVLAMIGQPPLARRGRR
jgi:glycosyltransferase involved in cell wall biosynthesis